MKTKFEKITSLDDIRSLIENSSNSDGETIDFELKGAKVSSKNEYFDKENKCKLANEIAALANTYGGILCWHSDSSDDKKAIKPFESQMLNRLQTRLDTWLNDCIEPKLSGLDLKVVDNVFLIYIPESKNKQHRSSVDKQYYYRNITTSNPMPEIMIAAMYRSGDYLDFAATPSLGLINNTLASFSCFVKNKSNVAGTKPRVSAQVFGFNANSLQFKDTRLRHYGEGGYSYQKFPGVYQIGKFNTNEFFANEILYPGDSLYLGIHPNITDYNPTENNLMIICTEIVFLELSKKTYYSLIDLNAEGNEHTIIVNGDRNVVLKKLHDLNTLSNN